MEPGNSAHGKGKPLPNPVWDSEDVQVLTDAPCSFNPRQHHAVRMRPNWLLVGYTPLGTAKLDHSDIVYLQSCEFPLQASTEGTVCVQGVTADAGWDPSLPYAQVRALSPDSSSEDSSESTIDSDELRSQILSAKTPEGDLMMPGGAVASVSQCVLSADEQPDANTPLVGWDFSTGNPGDAPHPALERIELEDYLRVRGASPAYTRLRALGIEVPNDLQFLFVEDLVEHGLPEHMAYRIMRGIHPPAHGGQIIHRTQV